VSEQHQRFLERLAASSHAVFVVAQLQHAKGRTIEIPRTRFAPSAADAEDYVDGGDLIVVMRRRIEVKHLGVNFSSLDDWPFSQVFVSNVAAVDRADDVLAYVSVSHDFGCAAIVSHQTRRHWYVVEAFAKNTGNVERYYACPLELATFEPVPPEWR
jgi:hypothetical protein